MTRLIDLIVFEIQTFNIQNPLDVVDLLITVTIVIAFFTYMRRFPVIRVMSGILFLIILTLVAFIFNLTFTGLLFGFGTFIIFVSLPLIFAPEIRHYLEKLGRFSFFKLPNLLNKQKNEVFIRNLVSSVYELAERNVGGTIVIQRKTGLGQTIDTGVIIDARFGSKLLHSLFFPKSPLHDGAVVIKNNRIIAAGCLLPINSDIKLDPPFGTRHKAALALTQGTDAVVIVISEQRGEVSLAENGKLHINLSRNELIERLNKLL